MNAGIAERTVGQYPISIGTSLALESANGIHPDILVKSAPILEYEELWINVKTLFRNLMGAFDKVTAGMVHPEELAPTLEEEMDHVVDIINEGSNNRCKVVFYLSNYKRIEQKYPRATIRHDNTPKQMEYTAIQTKTLELMLEHNQDKKHPIRVFDLKLSPVQAVAPKILIISHYAYDLFSAKSFRAVTLLESHTGRIKNRALWYTKYANSKELSMIPFREDLVQVFGDAETFRSGDPKLRKAIIEIATQYNWSAVTTYDKIMLGLQLMKNEYAHQILSGIMTRQ